jgi:hypothetical protein
MERFGRRTEIVSHNAFANSDDAVGATSTVISTFYYQQRLNITAQLTAGARALMIDVFLTDDNGRRTLTLCHGQCTPLLFRSLNDTLIEIVSWLETPDHRNEIISIFIEDNTGGNVNDLYRQVITDSGASRLTIPQHDVRTRPRPEFHGTVAHGHRYITGAPSQDDDVRTMITGNQRLMFYVDRNVVGEGVNRTNHALPFVWHHFDESSYSDQDAWNYVPRIWFGGDGPRTDERGESRRRRAEGPRAQRMSLVNHFGVMPPWFNPGIGSRDRIVRTVCNYSQHTHLPPRYIAIDDIVLNGGAQQVALELNQQVWNETDSGAAIARYCQRNQVGNAFALMGAFPLSLLIAFGILAIVGVVFGGYKLFQRCRGGGKPKRD